GPRRTAVNSGTAFRAGAPSGILQTAETAHATRLVRGTARDLYPAEARDGAHHLLARVAASLLAVPPTTTQRRHHQDPGGVFHALLASEWPNLDSSRRCVKPRHGLRRGRFPCGWRFLAGEPCRRLK